MMYVYIGYYYKTAAVKFVTLQKTNAGWACFMQQELFSPGGVAFCHNMSKPRGPRSSPGCVAIRSCD